MHNLLSRVFIISCLYCFGLFCVGYADSPNKSDVHQEVDVEEHAKAHAAVNAKPKLAVPAEPGVIKAIHTVDEFVCIGVDPLFPLSGNYRLANDLDIKAIVFKGIGSKEAPFIGHFDGNGCCIKGVSITAHQDYTGLFRMIGQDGIVEHLFIEADNIQGKAYTGSLAGYNQGIIRNCMVSGQVSGTNNVGGMVGINGKYGQIDGSKMRGEIKASRYEIGGLVGCNLGLITNSRVAVIVTGVRVVGGLVGMNDETGRIEHCLAKAEVRGQYFVGGLVGHNWFKGWINHCIAQADVMGEEYVGGLAGANYDQAVITKSSSIGRAQGSIYVGRVVGSNRGKISYGLTMQDKWREQLIPGRDSV